MTRLTLPLLALVAACAPAAEPAQPGPRLADVDSDADAAVDLFTRSTILSGAVESEYADLGVALDPADPGSGFLLEVDAEPVDAGADAVPALEDYANFLHGVAAKAVADVATVAVVAIPAAILGATVQGTVTPVADNVWHATATGVVPAGVVRSDMLAAWVGVGWLAQVNLTTSDGQWNGEPYLKGFVSVDGDVGWWDIHDRGTLAGVVEWIDDGAGHAELGLAAITGDAAGDVLLYLVNGTEGRVQYHDASLGEDAWVHRYDDGAGEVRLVDYNGGDVACWDSELVNATCE